MAESPAHKWGQVIGDFLENALHNKLKQFARKHKLYLDTKGQRPVRKGMKVSWRDASGNQHDLDFVLERGGTPKKVGVPVAFIESAWRRYTKHSRNKAQEIQGAILPLVATHRNYAPFIGVVLAGEFTGGALNQLRSLGFNVLYFPYETIVKTFAKYGIDASSEENTPEHAYQEKLASWERFPDKSALANRLFRSNVAEANEFFARLEKAVSRYIDSVSVTALHGTVSTLQNIDKAIAYIRNYHAPPDIIPVLKYEIVIKYNNGDKVEATFGSNDEAIEFLSSYNAPKPLGP